MSYTKTATMTTEHKQLNAEEIERLEVELEWEREVESMWAKSFLVEDGEKIQFNVDQSNYEDDSNIPKVVRIQSVKPKPFNEDVKPKPFNKDNDVDLEAMSRQSYSNFMNRYDATFE